MSQQNNKTVSAKVHATDRGNWWEFKVQGGPQGYDGEGQLQGGQSGTRAGIGEVTKSREKKHINGGEIERKHGALRQ